MPESTSAVWLAGVIALALNAYVILAGADFGGGVWDLLARGPRREEQRRLIANAIGPIWEANHVWLILAVVLLFTCFPPVYARLGVVLHIPLTLMLFGIVLRGSAFVFRGHFTSHDPASHRWGRVFAIASLVTPILLGISIGAVASGRVGSAEGSFSQTYLEPWLTPFALGVGIMALVLFAFLAAVYLTLEAEEKMLREDFRRRALATGIVAFPVAMGVLFLARSGAPMIERGLISSAWA
ncbi:MAG: cytochrome d ubiquinol oxidase subunit II, partial [Gemmatimonadales bacterium]